MEATSAISRTSKPTIRSSKRGTHRGCIVPNSQGTGNRKPCFPSVERDQPLRNVKLVSLGFLSLREHPEQSSSFSSSREARCFSSLGICFSRANGDGHRDRVRGYESRIMSVRESKSLRSGIIVRNTRPFFSTVLGQFPPAESENFEGR